MKEIYAQNAIRHKPWKKAVCALLSFILAFGAAVTMLFGNVLLSDYVDFGNLITANAAESDLRPVPVFYRHGELVGLYRVNYTDKTELQYKIGEEGEWTAYKVPFTIPAHKTTKVYARIGDDGKITYASFSNTKQAIGVYSEENTDFEFSYNNIDFGYTRIYNSADRDWFESIHSKVLVTNSRLEVTLPDSSKYPMIRKDADTYVDELNGYTLTKADNAYVFDDGRYKYYFAIKSLQSVAYLSAIEDYAGNKLNLNRTANTEEIAISDGAGRSFALSDFRVIDAPDGSGADYYSQKEITDPNGNKIEYTTKYDRYMQVKDQAGVLLGKYEYKSPTDYTLTRSTDKTIAYYDNGRIKQITYDNGAWLKYTYDDEHMTYTTLTSSDETTKTVYNDAFLPVEYTDEYAAKTEYTYDDCYRVKTEKTDSETTTYTYDDKGNVLSYETGNAENDTYYTYDAKGNVIREKTGNTASYYTYDGNKNVLVSATLKEDYKGEMPQVYDAGLTDCFDTISYTYDEKGRVTKEEDSTGSVCQYEYDESGNVLKETSTVTENDKTETTVTTYTYDEMGNVLTTQCDKENCSYIYDKAGRTLLSNDSGKCTRTIYDEYGRVVQEIAPEDYDSAKDGLPNENTYADANVGQRYEYDEQTGNLTSETNRLNVKTSYTYYSTGEKKQESFDSYVYSCNRQGQVTTVKCSGQLYATYEYDENANNTRVVYGNGQIVNYDYDEDNNLIARRRNDEQTPYITMAYTKTEDEVTYLSSKTDYECGRVTYYDKDGSITSIQTTDGETVFTKSVTESGETDETKEVAVSQSLFHSSVNSKYTKDNAEYTNKVSTMSVSASETEDSATTKVAFNSVNRLTETYEYADGKLAKKTTKADDGKVDYVETLAYDEQGRIIKVGEGRYTREFEYKNNRLVRDRYPSTSAAYELQYTYDSRGNLKSSKKYGLNGEGEVNYSRVEEDTTYEYNKAGDLTLEDTIASSQDVNFEVKAEFDINGNPLKYKIQDYDFYKFEWTNGRQLKKISIIDEEDPLSGNWIDIAEYTYDENGIKTSVKAEGKTTYFIYEGNTLLGQYTDNDGTTENAMQFLYDENGEIQGVQYSRSSDSSAMYYYQKDIMGNVYTVRNASGGSSGAYKYEAYGHNFFGYGSNDPFQNINPIKYRGYY